MSSTLERALNLTGLINPKLFYFWYSICLDFAICTEGFDIFGALLMCTDFRSQSKVANQIILVFFEKNSSNVALDNDIEFHTIDFSCVLN